MKKFAKLSFAIAMALSLAIFTPAAAQNREGRNGKHQRENAEEFQKKLHEQKVEFLTKQLNLTEAEASKFWPVYDNYDNQRSEAMKKQMSAFKKLAKAQKDEKKGAELEQLIKAYTDAQAECRAVEANFVSTFSPVLSTEQLAKLILGEEFYRREQFRRMNQGGPHHNGDRQGPPRRGGDRGPRQGGFNDRGMED